MSSSSYAVEDLIHCVICHNKYDELLGIRAPKFLPCSHTFCLLCLTSLHKETILTCPTCNFTFNLLDLTTLPNNVYAFHLIKLKEKMTESHSKIPTSPISRSWCLTCGLVTSSACITSHHSLFNITATTVKNLEVFFKFKDDLQKLKDQTQSNLLVAFQKRKEIRDHLELVMKSVQIIEKEINQLQDTNDTIMEEITSMLDNNDKIASPGHSKDPTLLQQDFLLSELMSLKAEDSCQDDVIERLIHKWNRATELSGEKIRDAKEAALKYGVFESNNTKIAFQLFDQHNQQIATFPKESFNSFLLKYPSPMLKKPHVKLDFALLLHTAFSILRRKHIEVAITNEGTSLSIPPSITESTTPPNIDSVVDITDSLSNEMSITKQDEIGSIATGITAVSDQKSLLTSTSLPPSTSTFNQLFKSTKKAIKNRKRVQKMNPVLLYPTIASVNFVFGKSIFVLQVFQSDVCIGEIHMLPVPTSRPNFVQKLGDYCFESPKKLCNSFGKILKRESIIIPMIHHWSAAHEFEDFFLTMDGTMNYSTGLNVSDDNEVGINFVICNEKIAAWGLSFSCNIIMEPQGELFGKVVNGQHRLLNEIIKQGSHSLANWTLTLQSQ